MIFEQVTFLTDKLQQLKQFYTDTLELELIEEASQEFTISIGWTNVTFRTASEGEAPYYHFAINIPENQFAEARAWAKSRVDLTQEQGEDEVFFTSWNAHSVYFDDPAGNIVELIARHNLNNGIDHSFTSKDFLCISEIGVVREEVIPYVRELNEMGLPNWKEDSEGLTPVGDEHGLLIVVKLDRPWFFSNQRAARPFPLEIAIRGIGTLKL